MGSPGRRNRKAPVRVGVALAALLATLVLAACGSGIEGPVTVTVSKVALQKKASGDLTISNWPLYIDKKTVPNFEKATGVNVEYKEDINSNEEFFNKVQPQLTNGESGGRSIMVLADYMVAKMIKLGYLEELNHEALPEVKANLAKNLRHPPFDPERQYSVPWQSGMTGIIVNKEKAPEVHSICDLFNPKYKGKVDFLNEVRETVPLVMKCEGVEPRKSDRSRLAESNRKNQGGRRRRPDQPLHRQRLRPGPDQRQRGRGDRLVGRRGATPGRQPETSNGGCRPKAACSGRKT